VLRDVSTDVKKGVTYDSSFLRRETTMRKYERMRLKMYIYCERVQVKLEMRNYDVSVSIPS
jgi:hypothetical protein